MFLLCFHKNHLLRVLVLRSRQKLLLRHLPHQVLFQHLFLRQVFLYFLLVLMILVLQPMHDLLRLVGLILCFQPSVILPFIYSLYDIFLVIFWVCNKPTFSKSSQCLRHGINIVIVFSSWESSTLFYYFFRPSCIWSPY